MKDRLAGMQVFFDLDGTLTDPQQGIIACIRHALAALEIEIDDASDLSAYIGPPLRSAFHELCPQESQVEPAVELYRERFGRIGLYENRLYDGIAACLDGLADRVGSLYVVTSKPTVYSRRIVEHFGIGRHFKVVYGSHLDGSLADKTDLIGHVIASERIDPRRAVMIGDRKFDVIGARNHGLRSIGVLWGYGSQQELRDAGADGLCASPADIPDLLAG